MGTPYVRVSELFVGRDATIFDANGPRTYIRKFLVETTDKELAGLSACYAPGIPRPYSPYVTPREYDLQALLVRLSATQRAPTDGDWEFWEVTCEYSTELPEDGIPEIGEAPGAIRDTGTGDSLPSGAGLPRAKDIRNAGDRGRGPGRGGTGGRGKPGSQSYPEFEPPEISWDWESEKVSLIVDLDGELFVNSAGDPIIPPPEEPIFYRVLNFTRNELGFNAYKADKYAYVVNKTPFLGAPPNFVLSYPPKATQLFKGGVSYWRVSYKFVFRKKLTRGEIGMFANGWQPEFVDMGFNERINGKLVPIKLPGGANPKTPRFLDGQGLQAKVDEKGVPSVLTVFHRRTKVAEDLNVLLAEGLYDPTFNPI